MKRIAFARPRCGDGVVSRLLALSGPRWEAASFPSEGGRARALLLL